MGTYDPYSDRDCPEPGHEGFRAGYQASGNPWCPLCRRAGKHQPTETTPTPARIRAPRVDTLALGLTDA